MTKYTRLLLVGTMLQPLSLTSGAWAAAPQGGHAVVLAQADAEPGVERRHRPRATEADHAPTREGGTRGAGAAGNAEPKSQAPGREPHKAAPAKGEAPIVRRPAAGLPGEAAEPAGTTRRRNPAANGAGEAGAAGNDASTRRSPGIRHGETVEPEERATSVPRRRVPANAEAPAQSPGSPATTPGRTGRAAGTTPGTVEPNPAATIPRATEIERRRSPADAALPGETTRPRRRPAGTLPSTSEPGTLPATPGVGEGKGAERSPRTPADASRPDAAREPGRLARPNGNATPEAPTLERDPDERGGRAEGRRDRADHGGRLSPGVVGAGAAAGLVGGLMAAGGARRIDEIRRDREERVEGDYRIAREPGRTIVRDRDHAFIVHDESERFRDLFPGARVERRGRDVYTYTGRPGEDEIITITDDDGRLVRRLRRGRDGREIVLIDNGPRRSFEEDIVDLPPPPIRIPRDRYVVLAEGAEEGLIYETLVAPPLGPLPRRYTLDQVRYSPDLRARMRSIDVDTINFDSGSWTVTSDQAGRLDTIAAALKQAIKRNRREVFLVEGYTDAVGSDVDNLSLSDRRAQSVAAALTQSFGVPPENLTTQGYGKQFLKVNTAEASRINRRVTIRRITPLLNAQKVDSE